MSLRLKKTSRNVNDSDSNTQGWKASLKLKLEQFSELFGQSAQTKSYLIMAIISLVCTFLILLFLMFNLPRTVEQSRGVGELKYLNQMMIIQTQQFEDNPTDYTLQILKNSQLIFSSQLENVKSVYFYSPALNEVDRLWLESQSNITESQLQKIQVALNEIRTGSTWLLILLSLLLLISLSSFTFAVIKLFILRSQEDRLRLMELVDKDKKNQTAIYRLLDEIGDLAEGDLTKYAAVSADFTGTIADSINVAIDHLRDLVMRINQASQQVTQYIHQTQHMSSQLAQSSELQAREIQNTSLAIHDMADSIDHVSENAAQSAKVAQRAVLIAAKGGEVVERSIDGMDQIRGQIQETSKKIKRLGESSQEIGNFVATIEDIAGQTHLLALNAAIQAAMAGDAGRGFAGVADEVQRLAERSTAATKHIEILVKNIQLDTHEAVRSMEQTTSEVVKGTGLAQDAGAALADIQLISKQLAQLIANISASSKVQSAAAGQIAKTMSLVQDVTRENHASTLDTAQSIAELTQMADSLRKSVANFKLPE